MLLPALRIRSIMLSGTALMGLFVFGFTDQAEAACTPSVPGAGVTVTCTGNDTTGVSGNAANVTLNSDNTTNINTTGVSAIDLGTGAAVNIASGAVVNSNASTITVDGGTITTFATSVVSSSAGPAIQFTGTAGTALTLTASGTISGGAGVAVDLGAANTTMSLTPTHNFVGNVVAGAGTNDILRLSSSSNGSFNVSNIGTQYLGFDLFQKNGTSIWTLTGTGSQAWSVSNGSLVGTIANLNANITNNANVTFSNTTGNYSSVMSGSGNLTKSGTGILTLSGTNTYSGGTTITGGGLQIFSDANLGSGNLSISSATLISGASFTSAKNITLSGAGGGTFDTNGFNTTLSGVLSGTGGLTKTGNGTLTLSNNNTYNGATLISAGSLVMNGTNASSATIASGARLGGTGTVTGITANGTLAPGNSIGTMNVTGPLVFNPGSIYEVEVDATGSSDRTIATGAITLNGGTVDVRAAAGAYNPTTNYTILQGLSLAGTFSNVTSDLMFLTPSLSYTANSAVLTLTRNSTNFSAAAQDPSQAQVANAIQNLGTGNDLNVAYMGLSVSQATQALETLSGEHNVGLTSASVASSGQVQSIIANRIQNLLNRTSQGNRAALHMTGNDDGDIVDVEKQAFAMLEPTAGGLVKNAGGKNFWTDVFGLFGRNDSKGTAPSQNRESGGILFGTDMALSPDTQFGVFGGWEKGEVYTDTQFANSDVESWHGGLYANHAVTPRLRLSGSLSGSYQDIDTTRHVQFAGFSETAKGDTEGFSASGFIEAGYTIPFDDIALEPYANVNIIHGSVNGYRETGGGASNLDVSRATITTPGHAIGIRAGKNIQIEDTTVDLHAKIGWEHRYGDLSDSSAMRFQGGASTFNVSGTPTSRNSATIGAGADMDVNASTSAYVGYEGSYAQDERNHGVSLGVKVSF